MKTNNIAKWCSAFCIISILVVLFALFCLPISSYYTEGNVSICLFRVLEYLATMFVMIFAISIVSQVKRISNAIICCLIVLGLIFSSCVTCSIITTYHCEEYGTDISNIGQPPNSKHLAYFPLYTRLSTKFGTESALQYLYDSQKIQGTTYYHIQNSADSESQSFTFDFELLKSQDTILMKKFDAERKAGRQFKSDNNGQAEYEKFQDKDIIELRIIDENCVYYCALSNYRLLNLSVSDCVKIAQEEYTLIEQG